MMLNNLLTASDLEALPDWLKNVRQNFNLNDIDAPPVSPEIVSSNEGEHLYNKQLLELLERKDETIMELTAASGGWSIR